MGCEKGVARRGGATKERAKLGMLELLRATNAKVGAECGLRGGGAEGFMLCELAAAESVTLAEAGSSSCVDKISMGPVAGSLKKLRAARSSIGQEACDVCMLRRFTSKKEDKFSKMCLLRRENF